MRAYIAAPFNRRESAKEARAMLTRVGLVSTARWIDTHLDDDLPAEALRREATHDLNDIDYADIFILLNEAPSTTGAMHIETGYALAQMKPIYVVGKSSSLFHLLAGVTVVGSLEELIEMFRRVQSRETAASRA